MLLLQIQISNCITEKDGTKSFLKTNTLLTSFQGFEIKLTLALTCPTLEFSNHRIRYKLVKLQYEVFMIPKTETVLSQITQKNTDNRNL